MSSKHRATGLKKNPDGSEEIVINESSFNFPTADELAKIKALDEDFFCVIREEYKSEMAKRREWNSLILNHRMKMEKLGLGLGSGIIVLLLLVIAYLFSENNSLKPYLPYAIGSVSVIIIALTFRTFFNKKA